MVTFLGISGYSQEMEDIEIEKHIVPKPEFNNLKPEQRAQIEEINIETRKTIIPIRAQIELKEIELQKEMESEKPDKDKIMKIAKEIHELHWQIKKAQLEQQLKINALLTPEQREQLKMHKREIIKKRIKQRLDD